MSWLTPQAGSLLAPSPAPLPCQITGSSGAPHPSRVHSPWDR